MTNDCESYHFSRERLNPREENYILDRYVSLGYSFIYKKEIKFGYRDILSDQSYKIKESE